VRAAVRDRLTRYFHRLHAECLGPELARQREEMQGQRELLLRLLDQAKEQASSAQEVSMCLDTLVREVIRLQQQVESLTESANSSATPRTPTAA
jgi:hypothetical protein